jgi:hypothetical protein
MRTHGLARQGVTNWGVTNATGAASGVSCPKMPTATAARTSTLAGSRDDQEAVRPQPRMDRQAD